MIKDFLQDQAALHALGLLEAEEARAFEQAMASDPELSQLVEDHRETMAEMTRALPAEMPSAALKDQIMRAVQGADKKALSAGQADQAMVRPSGWMTTLGWGMAAACAVIAAWLWNQNETLDAQRRGIAMAEADARAAVVATGEQLKNQEAETALIAAKAADAEKQLNQTVASLDKTTETLAQTREMLAATEQQVAALRKKDALAQMQIATLQTSVKEYQQGVAVVVWDSEKQEGILKLEKMPPLATDKDYQLWVVDPKQKNPVDAGIVTVNAEGFAKVGFKPLTEVSEATMFAVSVERKGGVPVAEGPIVLAGP